MNYLMTEVKKFQPPRYGIVIKINKIKSREITEAEKNMLTLPAFEAACEAVKKVTQETGLIYSKYFSDHTGNKIYFKPENMQLTGAYKLRGAYYTIGTLTEEERQRGLMPAIMHRGLPMRRSVMV